MHKGTNHRDHSFYYSTFKFDVFPIVTQVQDEYNLILTLTDGHLGDGNYVTQSLLLIVDDVNDNEPIFKPYLNSVSVREDSSPGVLATVEATDADEGPYGQVLKFDY